MPQNSRFSQRDASWRTGGPSVHAPGDGLEGAYSAILHTAPSGGTCKVIVPALSLTQPKGAFCSQGFTGSVGDMVLVMFDENKEPWVLSNVSNNPAPPGHEWAYQQITSSVVVTSTTESAETLVMTAPTFTPDGGPVICEFYAPFIETGPATGANIFVCLFEGATELARLILVDSDFAASPGSFGLAISQVARYRFTPTSTAHTYKIMAFGAGLTGAAEVGAGPGGAGSYPPAFVRFVKV